MLRVVPISYILQEMHIEVEGEGKSRRKAEQVAADKAIVMVTTFFNDKQND